MPKHSIFDRHDQCVELITTTASSVLPRGIGADTRRCRNKGAIKGPNGLLCKMHARKRGMHTTAAQTSAHCLELSKRVDAVRRYVENRSDIPLPTARAIIDMCFGYQPGTRRSKPLPDKP